MKKSLVLVFFCMLLFSALPAHAKFPLNLGGFRLGDDIANYTDQIDMTTLRAITFNEYLGEGEIIPEPGFKTGLIAYGLCDHPNKIVRIKLKFEDSSKKFFKTLLKHYKKSFGEPHEYKGDPFQTYIAWKWSFTNEKNEKISLILQHNVLVEDEKVGTAVKMTLTSQIEKERACHLEKKPPSPKKSRQKKPSKEMFKQFVPY